MKVLRLYSLKGVVLAQFALNLEGDNYTAVFGTLFNFPIGAVSLVDPEEKKETVTDKRKVKDGH